MINALAAGLRDRRTTVRKEAVAGLTSFFTVAYLPMRSYISTFRGQRSIDVDSIV